MENATVHMSSLSQPSPPDNGWPMVAHEQCAVTTRGVASALDAAWSSMAHQ
jgi:hypothetical protein